MRIFRKKCPAASTERRRPVPDRPGTLPDLGFHAGGADDGARGCSDRAGNRRAVSEFRRNNRLSSASNDLLGALQLARTEAIKRQRTVALCATADPQAAEPACSGRRVLGLAGVARMRTAIVSARPASRRPSVPRGRSMGHCARRQMASARHSHRPVLRSNCLPASKPDAF